MPNHLKVGYYDAMILYAEADREEATTFLNHLRNIRLENGETIKAVLYDGPELLGLSGLKLEQLDKAFGRCSYTFVYLTKPLVKDVWCKISQESMLMRTVYDKDKQCEKWRVVPVYTMRRVEYDFKIPFGINALNGIRYYDPDEFYRKGVVSLIEKTVPERIRKKRRLEQKRRDWVEIHVPCHTDLSQECSPLDVSNDDFLTLDRSTMVQPQESKYSSKASFRLKLNVQIRASKHSVIMWLSNSPLVDYCMEDRRVLFICSALSIYHLNQR